MKTRLYKKLFFVYRIKVKGHKINYVGVTNNFDSRRCFHLRGIADMVDKIRFNRTSTKRGIPAYEGFAKLLVNKINKKHIFTEMDISIIDIFDNPNCAGRCEEKNIKKETKNGFNLNVQKKSTYVSNKEFIVLHPIRKKEKTKNGILIYQDRTFKFFQTNF